MQSYDSKTIPYQRGNIIDSSGTVLATSEAVYNVILDCSQMTYKEDYVEPTIQALLQCFPELKEEDLRTYAKDKKDSKYIVLAKKLPYDEIQKFVETTLRLSLNQKTCIRPISQGIEFVGYRIWPHYVTIRKSTTLEMKRHLRRKVEEYNAGLIEMEVVTATLKSYLGMLDHCDCKEFRKELIDSVVLDRNKVVGEIAYEVENYSEAMVCGL